MTRPRSRLPRLILLTCALLIACTGVLTAVAARRSTDDNGYHCLQLPALFYNETRLLIDLRSGGQIRLKVGTHRADDMMKPPLPSPDGRYIAYATFNTKSGMRGNIVTIWIDGADVSSKVLTQLPPVIVLFQWVTNRLLIVGGVIDQRLTIATVDVSDPHSPIVTRRSFGSSNSYADFRWIGDTLMVTDQGVFNLWSPQRNAWVSYELPKRLASAQMLLSLPSDDADQSFLAMYYNSYRESGLLVLDPERGFIATSIYSQAQLVEVTWLAKGTRLRTRLRLGGNTSEVTIWDVNNSGLIPILTDVVPDSATGEHLSVDDGTSYLYMVTTLDGTQSIRQHRLEANTVDKVIVADVIDATFPRVKSYTARTDGLFTYVKRQNGYAILWVNADGKVKTLAEEGTKLPAFKLAYDVYIGIWQTAAASRVLVIDLQQDAEVFSYPTSLLANNPIMVEPYLRFDHSLIISESLISGTLITYRVFNLRTGQIIPSATANVSMNNLYTDDSWDHFSVGWMSNDGRQGITEFAPDAAPVASFIAPATMNPFGYKISTTQTRVIVSDSLVNDKYLLFPDGTYKSLPQSAQATSSFHWSLDGSYIVGTIANVNSSVTDVYILDSDGNILHNYRVHTAWWSRDTLSLSRCQ
ncbi:MAG: hypothetical protein KF726_16175 [Anaerolineae bacterium]|nr:hypothetical protein [Anaerolineae bacterium]